MTSQDMDEGSSPESYVSENRKRWNELVAIHANSDFYDVAGFKSGGLTLKPLEVAEVGDVAGRSLLHLQCHFGLDTLSWARLGAKVTGVDFSDEAIALANSLAEECGLEARFICSDLYELPSQLTGKFDIVFTSYGVLCWLPDLRQWAENITHFLKPGGLFYIVEDHPAANIFSSDGNPKSLRLEYSYFESEQPDICESSGSYADASARMAHIVSYQWNHSLSEVINALISAGLTIDFLHEFPYSFWSKFPFLSKDADGWWRLPADWPTMPLMFSLRARRGP